MCAQTCGPSREQRWKRQAGPNPRWCCSCGEVDTSRTDGTDPESRRAGSFQHRCLSWGITVKLGTHILSVSYHRLEGQMRACHWPGDQNSHVVMRWVCVTLGVEVFLPSAETGQSRVCVVNDLQPFLQHRAELGFQYRAALCHRNFISRRLPVVEIIHKPL